ncbi:MAG: energy transducer TonB [Bacteroidota bacterium]
MKTTYKTIAAIFCLTLMSFTSKANTPVSNIFNVDSSETPKCSADEAKSTTTFLYFDALRNNSFRINEFIMSEIKYPDFAKEQNLEGTVYVEFSIDYDGTILVSQLNGNSEALNNYVKNEIENIYLLPSADAAKTYIYKFQFDRK